MENNMPVKDKLAGLRQKAIHRQTENHRRVKDASPENDNFNSLAEYVYIQAAADVDREKP